MQDNSRPLRIIHLRASNFYGGPERQLHRHALKAGACGLFIKVASFEENGKRPEFLETIARDNVETVAFKVESPYDPRSIKFLRQELKDSDSDILCTHDYRSHLIGFLATRGTKIRWVAFSRGSTAENLKVRLFQSIESLVIRYADHIVAVSGSEKRKLLRRRIRESKVSVVYNSIDSDLAAFVEPVDLRKRFGFPQDSVVAISAGRFSREKGQIYLAKAALESIKRNQRLRFILFGDGPDLEKIRRLVLEFNCPGKIICPGFEKNILGCLKGADILVNPSLSEGLPNIVLEAMALKVPVLATSAGGVPELIHHGESGILVPPGDSYALANAILELVEFWPLRGKLIDSALEVLNNGFSFDRQLKDLAQVYQAVSGQELGVDL